MDNVGSKVKWTFRIAIYALILYGVYFAVSASANGAVQKRASEFCRSIYAGWEMSSLIDEALKQGGALVEGRLDSEQKASGVFRVKFPSSGPFEGFECRINASDGLAVSKDFYHLD